MATEELLLCLSVSCSSIVGSPEGQRLATTVVTYRGYSFSQPFFVEPNVLKRNFSNVSQACSLNNYPTKKIYCLECHGETLEGFQMFD